MNKAKKGGRLVEMKVSIGAKTVERYDRLYAENDISLITESVKPKTTKATVSKHLQAASQAAKDGKEYRMPLSIATAAHEYYERKDKAEKQFA